MARIAASGPSQTRLTGGILGLGALLAALVVAAPAQAQEDDPGPPSGNGIQPVFVDGNPTCATLDPDTIELRVDPVEDGTFTDGTLTVTIDVRDTEDGPVFDWTSNIGVDSVFVKGSSDGNFYLYDPPAESTGDTSLHAAINPMNGKFSGLSHISFCYDVQASIKVEKSGDELSKVGDKVKYDFKITNDGDIPLELDSATDTLLGDLAAAATAAGCDDLAAGESCEFSVERTVQAGDPDPLPNTVTVEYSGTFPGGASAEATDSDDHSVNLFQPSVMIDKTGDTTLSKVGDTVNYEIKVTNGSSADSPDLICDVTDTLLGTLADDITLEPGDVETFTPSRVVEANDPDPLVNTASVDCKVDGFPNELSDSDDHSVNLFQPSVMIEKMGTELSKIGDPVDYTIKVTNTSSADSPNLTCDISDPTVGVDKQDVNLGPGGVDNTSVDDFVIPAGASDPFVNTASVDCSVDGFPNQLATQTASHEVNLFQPSVLVVKTGPSEAVEGDTITYDYTITNTSSADSPDLILETVVDDVVGALTAVAAANGCATLAPGGSCSFSADFTIPAGTPSPLVNTVVVDYHPDKFENEIKDDDDHSVIIKPPKKFEGCTPGFWKNHLQAWVGFAPNQTLESVFNVPNSFGLDNNTLRQALSFQGGTGALGAARILLRAAVAALLNAAHPDVDYPRTVAEVIADVNSALASGNRATMLALAAELDADNNRGCPI